MRLLKIRHLTAGLLMMVPAGLALGDEPQTKPAPAPATPTADPAVGLLDAARKGDVSVQAQGAGPGRITVRVTNNTNRRLRIVLPPGLIASGATGQFGGMGGGGGGMGGGGMGGGMGGGGMGGGGMGGGGMGGGGMGGGMGGGGMSGGRMLTMPATMGMMMLGRLIMTLIEPETWNPASLMSGMMGMGGGGMGGMGGGGMGGMGGGGMGGMGGGFRSVPPTELPHATLQPGQSRELATRIVALNAPSGDGSIAYPAMGEALQLDDAVTLGGDPRMQVALRRLARDKAPDNISQLVLWATAGMSWNDIARLSQAWANPNEMALARQLVEQLDANDNQTDTGRLLVEVVTKDDAPATFATTIRTLLTQRTVLGLQVDDQVPAKPHGPSVACRVQVQGTVEKPEALVQLATSDAQASAWTAVGKFTLPLTLKDGKLDEAAFGDALADELLKRLVKVAIKHPSAQASGTLIPRTAKQQEKVAYTVQVDNYSPLMLNGIALVGTGAKETDPLRVLAGIALSPRRRMSLPVSGHTAEAFGLKAGVKVMALDLSGL